MKGRMVVHFKGDDRLVVWREKRSRLLDGLTKVGLHRKEDFDVKNGCSGKGWHPFAHSFQEKTITFECQWILFLNQQLFCLFQQHLPINWAHLKLKKVRHYIDSISSSILLKKLKHFVSRKARSQIFERIITLNLCNQYLRDISTSKTCIQTIVGEI